MQVLIAHRDVDMGEQLAQMVIDYTPHDCELVGSMAAALDWARRRARCRMLITQLEAEDFDGLALGASFSEFFPGLQTVFLPAYQADEQRLQVLETKVFPEPIDGEALLAAIERAGSATDQAADLFYVADIIQMCCLSGKSGALQMVKDNRSGIVFLQHGRVAHAETAGARGRDAIMQLVSWEQVEFAYDGSVRPPVQTIHDPWDDMLIELLAPAKEPNDEQEERRSA